MGRWFESIRADMKAHFKNRCRMLRKEGRTINEIMRITGGAKTSVYTHIQNIPLSTKRWKQIRKKSGEHIRAFALARTGKSTRPFATFQGWTPKKVLLVAHLLFDGEIAKRKCVYNNRSSKLVARVEALMKDIYDFAPKRYTDGRSGVTRIGYFNVALGTYLIAKSKELLRDIKLLPLECKREFLRAFFDDEGCMDFRPQRAVRQIRGYQKNTPILYLVRELLQSFEIQSSIKLPNEVIIRRKDNLLRFQKEINFSLGVCINGNRHNSIWKKSFPKRELLERAIKSFKN